MRGQSVTEREGGAGEMGCGGSVEGSEGLRKQQFFWGGCCVLGGGWVCQRTWKSVIREWCGVGELLVCFLEGTAEDTGLIVQELSKGFAEYQPQLRELLEPMAEQLIPELDTLFDAELSTPGRQVNAAMALADYAGGESEHIAWLLTRANQRQTEILYPKVAEFKSGPGRDGLLALTREQPDENLGQQDRGGGPA